MMSGNNQQHTKYDDNTNSSYFSRDENYYDILGININASSEKIAFHYRALLKKKNKQKKK